MNIIKKIISVCLAALIMISSFSCLNIALFAAAEEYGLWIEGSRVTSNNCRNIPVTGGSAAFDPSSGKLTLNNATLSSDSNEALIRTEGICLTIDALGESVLLCDDKSGISVQDSMTVMSSSGSGTLAFEVNKGENGGTSYSSVKVINVTNSFTMESGTITMDGNLYHRDIRLDDNAINASTCNFNGGRAVFTMNLYLYPLDYIGMEYACINTKDFNISENAEIEIDCKYPIKPGDGDHVEFRGIRSRTFTMTGGKISASVDGGKNDYAIYSQISAQISGGEIFADAGSGISGLFISSGNLQMSGGSIIAYGAEYGIFASDKLLVTGGSIRAIATADGRGICTNNGITITGVGISVYAKGGEFAMLNHYNGITIKDNAVICLPEGGSVGKNQYNSFTIVDQNGDPVKEATVLPAVSCSVSRNGGEEIPAEFNLNGTNEFEVPVGETCSVKLVSNIPDKKLLIGDINGPLPRASIFLRTSSRAIIATLDFAPTYRPTGTSSNGETSVENDSITSRIRYVGDSYSIPAFGAIRFKVVKGDLTLACEDADLYGVTPGEWVSVGTLTAKNAGGQTVNSDATDAPFDKISLISSGGPVTDLRLSGNSIEAKFDNTFGSSQVSVSFPGNDSFNPASTTFTVSRYCACKSGGGLVYHAYQAPTCRNGSSEYWECEACGTLYADKDGITVYQGDPVIPATGEHKWGKNTYTWANDNTTCIASCRCTVTGCTQEITETVKAAREQTKDPTCEGKGEITLTAAFGNKRFDVQIKTEDIAPNGHTPAESVKEKEIAPTCTEAGSYDKVVYCADCGKELSRKTVKVSALGHEDADNDGKCDHCGERMQGGGSCELCGKIHDTHTFLGIAEKWCHKLIIFVINITKTLIDILQKNTAVTVGK